MVKSEKYQASISPFHLSPLTMSMSDIAIKAENLGKKYIIGHQAQRGGYVALRDVLAQGARSFWRKTKDMVRGRPVIQGDHLEEVWALQDVSFEVQRGEALGIIGRNGAGKSTLLKVLSRITEPSAGRVTIKGRVASLLEVGTGFHPELTGRENIFLNGTIMGMRREEIKKKFDEIVAFAEVEKYLDTPVKRYSSGMYVRLAFSVAAHLEPEILVVDEVLAVGDARFQKKCLGKMKTVSGEGRTVLFVSHNMLAIQSLCERAIWLENGLLSADGQSDAVISRYLQMAKNAVTERHESDIPLSSQNGTIVLHRASVRPVEGAAMAPITIRTPIAIEFKFSTNILEALLDINISLYTEQNILAFMGGSYLARDAQNHPLPISKGRYTAKCFIPGDLLNDGMYNVRLFFGKDNKYVVASYEDILSFEVQDAPERRGATSLHKIPGVFRPKLKWTIDA